VTIEGPAKVLFEVTRGVGVITLNRPEVRNAVDREVSETVAAYVDECDERADVTAIVLTGHGPVFCAGMDLKAFARGERPAIDGRGLCGITETSPAKPLVVAVEGPALAGGFELALAADVVVAGDSATFGLPEVRRGLVAAAGGLLRLAASVPSGAAMELALTGAPIPARRAHELGLVTHVVTPGLARHAAVAVAERIAENAPLAVRLTKRVLAGAYGRDDRERYRWHREVALPAFDSDDAAEGARAFAEKRAPRWTGR
jgi:enoyl-CoA hydratase